MSRILVIHGPNLNLLGTRESHHYGLTSLETIDKELVKTGQELGVEVGTFQSNHEGEIVDRIQKAPLEGYDAIVINPAAFTHTSVAVRDALIAASLPFVEVHISNIHSRETFRQKSLVSDIASGIVTGFGTEGYNLALKGAHDILKTGKHSIGEENS